MLKPLLTVCCVLVGSFDGDLVSDGASSPSDETDGDDDDEQSPAAGAASEEWEGIQRTASGEGGFAGAGEFDPDTMGDAYRQVRVVRALCFRSREVIRRAHGLVSPPDHRRHSC